MNREHHGEKASDGVPAQKSESHEAREERRLWAVRWVVIPFVALYAAGYLLPQTWWGTHFIYFLPQTAAFGIAASAVFLIFLFKPSRDTLLDRASWIPGGGHWSVFVVVLFAIACAVVYFGLTTETDIFGDARRNLRYVTGKTGTFDPDWLRQLFRVDILDRTAGESLVLHLVLLTGWLFKIDGPTAFGVVNAAFGFVYVLAWCLFVRRHLHGTALRTVVIAAGVTAGFAAVFTNHAEVYAAGMVFMLLYLAANVQCLSGGSRWSLWALPVLLFLAIRSFFGHNILWVPFVLTMAWLELKKYEWFTGRFNRRWIFLAVVLPIVAAFAVYYVFVAGNHEVSRYVGVESRNRFMFLPFIHAEPPGVPRYTIFSFYHVMDFVNVMFLWSAPALFLVVVSWAAFAGRGFFRSPQILVVETTLLLYTFAFFVTNPLLSMPRDWDLFSMAAPALLVYSVLLLEKIQDRPGVRRRLVGPVLGLAVLGAPVFAVNHVPDMLTRRLEMLGLLTYKTYFYGASYILNVAVSMSAGDPDEYLRRRIDVVEKARAYKLDTDDVQFADLTYRLAELYVERSEYSTAKRYLYEAFYEKPQDAGLRYCLAQVHYNLGEYMEALLFADELSKKLIDEPDIQALAFLAAYEAGEFNRALVYGRRFLALRPNDADIKPMVDSLASVLEKSR